MIMSLVNGMLSITNQMSEKYMSQESSNELKLHGGISHIQEVVV